MSTSLRAISTESTRLTSTSGRRFQAVGRRRETTWPPQRAAARSVNSVRLANREDALHACGGMSRHRAEVRVLALLLEGDDEPRRRARLDQRGVLSVDLEVVQDMADVLEDECDLARRCGRLGRELEEELAALDLHGGALGSRRGPGLAATAG